MKNPSASTQCLLLSLHQCLLPYRGKRGRNDSTQCLLLSIPFQGTEGWGKRGRSQISTYNNPFSMEILTKPALFLAFNFANKLLLWDSTVLRLINNLSAIS